MSKGVYVDYMLPGVTVCEFHDLSCRKTAVGEFKRTRRECRAGWDKDMPISLCETHSAGRISLTKNELDKLALLLFDL